MPYELMQQPMLLHETVSMLAMYINDASYVDSLNRMGLLTASERYQTLASRAQRLQQIMTSVCSNLDRNDPALRRYFAFHDGDKVHTCLAWMIVSSMAMPGITDFRAAIEVIKAAWKRIQEQGAWLKASIGWGITFTTEPGSPGNLIRQIRALKVPKEMQLDLCEVLTSFDESMDELADRIEPCVRKLELALREHDDLLKELIQYWEQEFRKEGPLELLESFCGTDAVSGARDETIVNVMLMNPTSITFQMGGTSVFYEGKNVINFGAYVTSDSFVVRSFGMLEHVTAILKYLGDRKRLEIIQCLSRDRLYAMELAESVRMNPGNLSRALAGLCNYGFVRQERDGSRAYYQADRETFHQYLQLLEQTLFD